MHYFLLAFVLPLHRLQISLLIIALHQWPFYDIFINYSSIPIAHYRNNFMLSGHHVRYHTITLTLRNQLAMSPLSFRLEKSLRWSHSLLTVLDTIYFHVQENWHRQHWKSRYDWHCTGWSNISIFACFCLGRCYWIQVWGGRKSGLKNSRRRRKIGEEG